MRRNIVLIVVLFFTHLALTQVIPPRSPLIVNIDISRFRLQPDSGYLEICYAVYPSNVTLENVNNTLQGSIVLQTKIKNTKNDSLIVDFSARTPIIIKDTISLQGGYVGKSIYALPCGSYELIVQSYDDRNPARKDSTYRKFSIDRYDSSLVISDIDLCSKIVQSNEKENLFYKNSYEVTPNPSRLFGGPIAPVVFSYAELYNINPDSMYSIIVGILDGKGNFVKQRKRTHRYSARSVVDVNSLNIYSAPSGKYRFVLIVADTFGVEAARSEKLIFIYNPHIQSIDSVSISEKSADFIGLSNDELVDEFRKVRYIATDDDIRAFDKLKTVEAKREFLASFWGEIESGRRGRSDVTRVFYLDRVRTATQRYHSMGREGWHTDRGRIYILYGEPDEVQRFPSSDNAKPYEIWNYYQIESGVQFVFVDRSAMGEYSLVHSTKRGEIQDENWERNLR